MQQRGLWRAPGTVPLKPCQPTKAGADPVRIGSGTATLQTMLLSLILPSLAATWTVGPSQPYNTIGSAYNVATDGDTIVVEPGTYSESFDFRAKDVILKSMEGPAWTVLAPSNSILLTDSTLEGFRIEPAPANAIAIYGNATLRQLHIVEPASYGVGVVSGNPTIEEVRVEAPGRWGFVINGGSPTIRRCISENAPELGFALQSTSTSTLQNSVAIGGQVGIRAIYGPAVISNSIVVGSTRAGIYSGFSTTVSNSVFQDNLYMIECNGVAGTTTSNGVSWPNSTVRSCDANSSSQVNVADPRFTRWATGTDFYSLDFHPLGGSPMIDTGSGTDTDGSTADYGLFGGSQGRWTDFDTDGVPVLFDCDDREALTYPGAQEYTDSKDNDCDGQVDDNAIPLDSGGEDSVVDTEVPEPPDPDELDLDGDGYLGVNDCDDHNVASYPGATEIPDYADNDCDEKIDEGTLLGDDDGDSFSEVQGDCNDNDISTYPNADDDQNDGIDNDCDGKDNNARGRDSDGDDYDDNTGDCDDTNADVHPGVSDVTNGRDDDCDGQVDEDGLNVDRDRDGSTVLAGDCNDNNSSIYPGATDIADDFIDQDCTGTDNYDVDRDGDPSPASGGLDCNDNNSTISSKAEEICGNLSDEDCNGADATCESPVKPDPGTCGCSSGTAPGAAGLLLLGTLLLRRRKTE